MTAVANAAFTAAQWNTHVRDNLNETAPAKATVAGRLFVTVGVNQIAERAFDIANVTTSQSTTSTSYTDLTTAGPSITVTTSNRAFLCVNSGVANSNAGSTSYFSHEISGATSAGASDDRCGRLMSAIANASARFSYVHQVTGATSGSNTFTMKYRAASGTATFFDRSLIVLAM